MLFLLSAILSTFSQYLKKLKKINSCSYAQIQIKKRESKGSCTVKKKLKEKKKTFTNHLELKKDLNALQVPVSHQKQNCSTL